MSDAMREMSLQEWVERLPRSHRARKEYDALLAASTPEGETEALLRESARALYSLTSGSATWELIQRIAAALGVTVDEITLAARHPTSTEETTDTL